MIVTVLPPPFLSVTTAYVRDNHRGTGDTERSLYTRHSVSSVSLWFVAAEDRNQ